MGSGLTLEKIARLSGVSRSTVSRVINNHPNVSDQVRQRVRQVIAETGYLVTQQSGIIDLVIPRAF